MRRHLSFPDLPWEFELRLEFPTAGIASPWCQWTSVPPGQAGPAGVTNLKDGVGPVHWQCPGFTGRVQRLQSTVAQTAGHAGAGDSASQNLKTLAAPSPSRPAAVLVSSPGSTGRPDRAARRRVGWDFRVMIVRSLKANHKSY